MAIADPQFDPAPHRFTVEEYQEMGRVGVLDPECRFELIDGEVIEMNPINWPHARIVTLLNNLLMERYGDRVWVSPQNPLHLSDRSMPQPDLVLVRRGPKPLSHPTPRDVVLVVEVSDSTLAFDRNRKLGLFAEAGVPEVWIVDVKGQAVEAYRRPGPAGYGAMTRHGAGATLSVELLADGPGVAIDEIFA